MTLTNYDYTFKDADREVDIAQVIERYNVQRTKHPDKKIIFVDVERDKI